MVVELKVQEVDRGRCGQIQRGIYPRARGASGEATWGMMVCSGGMLCAAGAVNRDVISPDQSTLECNVNN